MKKLIYILAAIAVTIGGLIYVTRQPVTTDRAVKEQVIKGNLRVTESVLTDTIKMGDYNWLATSGEFNLRFGSIYSPGDLDTLQFNVGNQSSGMYSFLADAGYYFTPLTGGLRLQVGDAYYSFDGDYFYNATDTLATQAYARSEGGGGGGSVIDISGTPSANTVAVWSDANTLKGSYGMATQYAQGVLYMDDGVISSEGAFAYVPGENKLSTQKLNLTASSTPGNTYGLAFGTNQMNIYVDSDNNDTYFDVGGVTNIKLEDDTAHFYQKVVFADKIFAPALANDTLGFVVIETTTGEFKAGVLDPVFYGLTDPLIDFEEWLADTLNKEIKWRYVQNGEIKESYGLPGGMDNFESLQYKIEMLIRDNVRQDKEIDALKYEIDLLKEANNYPAKVNNTLICITAIFVLITLFIIAFLVRKK